MQDELTLKLRALILEYYPNNIGHELVINLPGKFEYVSKDVISNAA